MLTITCRLAMNLASDRVLSPPDWTAAVGQRWAPIDEAPYNLYNLLWWIGQRIAGRAG